MLFIKGSSSVLSPTSPELRKLLVFRLRKHKYKKTLKIFSLNNKFSQSPESAVPNTMICGETYLTKATSRNLSI